MPIEICKKENCTGCFACMNICPKDAITKGEDEYAKSIPIIDKEKCVECGLCVKVCPINQPVKLCYPQKCYAAWGKDEKEREGCSSGGIASILSKLILKEKGVVYGAAFNNDLELFHVGSEDEKEVEKFKGSKYVQSYMGWSYRQIRRNLQQGKKVLFIGTPCQVAGIRSFFGKDNENLLTVDIVCHGTPPMKYLNEHILSIDKKQKAKNISFRGKNDFYLTLYDDVDKFYCRNSESDFYFYAFLKGLIYRNNCYTCEWAKAERCSDITIGDFWGMKKESLKESYQGKVSVVLINTSLGEQFWEKYKEYFYWEEREVEEAIDGNAQLRKPSICHPDRERFLNVYRTKGFEKAVKTPRVCRAIGKGRLKASSLYQVAKRVKKRILRT